MNVFFLIVDFYCEGTKVLIFSVFVACLPFEKKNYICINLYFTFVINLQINNMKRKIFYGCLLACTSMCTHNGGGIVVKKKYLP